MAGDAEVPLLEVEATVDVNDDGKVDLVDTLLSKGFAGGKMGKREIKWRDSVTINWLILVTWPLLATFLLTQPLVSNWANNKWFSYSAEYQVFGENGSLSGSFYRRGICDTPASEIQCTDGQNFTELALKYRGAPYGCGCGQGILGEGLCPMTFYGFTLSDFVSTEPAIAAMLGLGFFPLLGTWRNTQIINAKAKPSKRVGLMHIWSMVIFQFSYIAWGIASCCIFPTAHALLTVAFLGSFFIHWVITAFICFAHWGLKSVESKITLFVAVFSVVVMTFGAIPRVFLTLNMSMGTATFPNWNRGVGAYAFWFAEAAGLSATFGAYPMVLIAFNFKTEHRPDSMRLSYWAPFNGKDEDDRDAAGTEM